MSDWTEALGKYKGKTVAVYGLGKAAEEVAKQLKGQFFIAGLLDSFRESGSLYGYDILDLNEALLRGTACIVAAARPGSCRAIERRIGAWFMRQGVGLVDMRGKDLLEKPQAAWRFPERRGRRKEDLSELARGCSCISFDLFDTLVTRKTLYFSDFLELVRRKLTAQGIQIPDFAEKRLACELELSRQYAPSLLEIYQRMKERYGLEWMDCDALAETEWETDLEVLMPRKEMCSILKDFAAENKRLCIITDSYYGRKQIAAILAACGITDCKEVIISSEHKTAKTQELFGLWRERIGQQPALHIGDDLTADIDSAARWGIIPYRVYSGQELMEETGYLGLGEELDTWSGRWKAGLFASRLFNSPFQFEEDGAVAVTSPGDAGYIFFAPLLTDFARWLERRVREQGIGQILFAARDGYLLKKLFDQRFGDIVSCYFLTSRTAAIRAGTERLEDLRLIEEMRFSGSVREELSSRFGLHLEEDAGAGRMEDYKEAVLERCGRMRENYREYIAELGLKKEKTAFFDFVSKGTSQYFLERILDLPLKGFYCMRLEKDAPFAQKLEIEAFCPEEDSFCLEKESGKTGSLYQDYYILEAVLTSPFPSVSEFDSEGRPVYEKEPRNRDEIACIEEVQQGIMEYWQDSFTFCEETEEPIFDRMDERLLALIHRIRLLGNPILDLKVQDPFFGRITPVSDLI